MRKMLPAIVATMLFLAAPAAAMAETIVAKIDIGSQTMTVTKNGFVKYRWKVSTARKGYVTPAGAFTAKWASKDHKSKRYNNTPMPYAIFYNGNFAVHATYDLKHLGQPASHGCVRLHPDNAAKFFAIANAAGLRNTRIVILN